MVSTWPYYAETSNMTKVRKVLNLLQSDGPGAASFWMLLDKGTRMVLGVFFNLVVARTLGPTLTGEYGTGLMVAYVLYPAFTMGLNELLIHEYAQHKDAGRVFGTSIMLKVMGAAAGLVAIGVYTILLRPDLAHITLTTLLLNAASFTFQVLDSADYYYQQQGNVRKLSVLKMGMLALFTPIKIALILMGADWLWVMLCIPLEFVGVYMGMTLISPSFRQLLSTFQVDWAYMAVLWKRVKVQLPATFASNTFMRLDLMLISVLGTTTDVGMYHAVVRFSEPWVLVPHIVSNSYASQYCQHKLQDEDKARTYWANFGGVMALISLVIVGSTWLGSPIVAYSIGNQYPHAIPLLCLHVLMMVFSTAGAYSWPWLVANHKTELWLARHLVGLVMLPVLAWLLWPMMGIFGVATALIITYGSIHFLGHALLASTREIFSMQLGAFSKLNVQNLKTLLTQRQ